MMSLQPVTLLLCFRYRFATHETNPSKRLLNIPAAMQEYRCCKQSRAADTPATVDQRVNPGFDLLK